MSRYGEKFDKALAVMLKKHLKRRTVFIVILSIFTAYFLMMGSILGMQQGENSVIGYIFIVVFAVLVSLLLLVIFLHYPQMKAYRNVVKRTCEIAYHLDGKETSESLKKEFKAKLKAKDKDWILQTTDGYYDRCEELKAKYAKTPNEAENEKNGQSGFDGWLIQEIGWKLLGILVTVVTLGLGFPLAYCWKVRWEYEHTLYDGKRLSFDGRASQLIGNWILWLLLSLVTCGIYIIFIPKQLMNWKLLHLHLAGEQPYLGGIFKGNPFVYDLVLIFAPVFTVLTLFLLKPFIMAWKNKYIKNRLIIDGRRMEFDGHGFQLWGRYLLWILLTCVTLGIYGFFVHIRLKKWVAKHTHIRPGYAQIPVI